jgi:hypothetical protein
MVYNTILFDDMCCVKKKMGFGLQVFAYDVSFVFFGVCSFGICIGFLGSFYIDCIGRNGTVYSAVRSLVCL